MTARRHALKNFKIMATDISEQALATARRGVYAARRFDQIPDSLRERFSLRISEHEAQIHTTLMSQVSFYRFNLMDVATAPFRRLDVIFCQNVLIYFKKFDRRDILEALVQRLELGGILVLGPGEMLDWQHPQMRRVEHSGTLAFERVKL
jgi:chemotaxis protein methyltransferase CheR/type IV pilus assembly protein PilK